MPQVLGIALLAIGGLASMGMISFVVIKTMINTTKYANEKRKHN